MADRWKSVLLDGLAFLFLLALNMWIAWRLFWVEYTPNFRSIQDTGTVFSGGRSGIAACRIKIPMSHCFT